eukprot:TRINITY_DN11381_c0_g1_i2.p1 TRINITY_DN11381_c0_g1~~TRINITY_DN11381_c0_g1_i2.p1  ORF type:complete len:427 (-),score=64.68 TRINITY_DN11381_c0_g1_i2:233-1513(-)
MVKVSALSEQRETRRPSFDNLHAKNSLQRLSREAVHELLPAWLLRLLKMGGGIDGNEPLPVKAVVLLIATANMVVAFWDFWLLGMPQRDFYTIGTFSLGFHLVMICTRWRFLQSGILFNCAEEEALSLPEAPVYAQILGAYSTKSRNIIVFNLMESVVIYGAISVIGLHLDVNGRAALLDETSRMLLWIGNFASMFLLHPVTHATIKGLPILFMATYDLAIEEMRQFHGRVDALFAKATEVGIIQSASSKQPSGSSATQPECWEAEVLAELQQLEHGLRTHLAVVNQVLSPQVGSVVACILVFMYVTAVVAITQFQVNRDDMSLPIPSIFFGWVSCMMCAMAINILRAAARVGDRWHQLVDNLNTPVLCVRSTAVLGKPLAERLLQLQDVGICIWGCVLNSRTVFSMAATMISSLALALLGTLITS